MTHRSWTGCAVITLAATLAATPAAADDIVCRKVAPNTQMTLSFKPDTSINDLGVWVASFTCKTVVFAAGVTKHATTMTILAPKPVTPAKAVALFVDALTKSGFVVEQKPDTILVKLGPTLPKNCPDLAVAPTGKDPFAPVPPQVGYVPVPEKYQAEIDAGVKKVDDTHFELKRSLVDKFLAEPGEFTKGARIVPAVQNGKPAGIKVYALRPSSLFTKLGLFNGDTLLSIAGETVDGADKTAAVATKLKALAVGGSVEVILQRQGKPVTISYKVVK